MNRALVKLFWQYIHEAEFEKLKDVMVEDGQVWLPNTKEFFKTRDKYILFNKIYPGRWFVDLEKIYECGQTVISIARIFSEESKSNFYVTSIFRFEDELISEITEYWSENGKSPEWRQEKELSELY